MATVTRYNANNTDIAQRFDEKTTAITAGTAGPTANATYDDMGEEFSFQIPRITVNSAGRVTAYSTSTITIRDNIEYYCPSDYCDDCSGGEN